MPHIIDQAELIRHLSGLRGATFCSIVAVTDPSRSGMRVNATDGSGDRNPWFEGTGRTKVCHLRKVTRTGLCLNENYDDGVRRQMVRQGLDPDAWEPGQTWYTRETRDDGTLLPFARHNGDGAMYLCGRNLRTIGDPVFIDIRTGEIVSEDEVYRFMPNTERYAKQRRAGVETVIARQVWGFEGIRAINIGGERFEIHRSFTDPENASVLETIAGMIAEFANDDQVAAARANEENEEIEADATAIA